MILERVVGRLQRVKLTSADPYGAMKAVENMGIILWDCHMTDDLTMEFYVHIRDIRKLKCVIQSRSESCEICTRQGIMWDVISLKHRPVLLIGLSFVLMLSLWWSNRILFIAVEGNIDIPESLILEEARTCGITLGASRRLVRSQKVKNQLLERIPQLQWAGVYTTGCTAVITIQERKKEEGPSDTAGICSIIATRDGVISSVTVLKGNGVCKPGQAVKKGQVLISGYTDCGICIRADHADGEVIAHTQYRLSANFPADWKERQNITRIEKKFSLIIGKKQINFYKDSGILGMSCAKIYKQKYITLPGGFQLPVSVLTEQRVYYKNVTNLDMDGTQCLQNFSKHYILSQTQGGRIAYMQEVFREANGCLILDGSYGCIENIGKVQMEEELPNYGKND